MGSQNNVRNNHLLEANTDIISPMVNAIHDVRSTVSYLADNSNQLTAKKAAIVLRKLDSFAPSITLIGQVKAGKTALVNALVGRPNLLPSDINPWTSVVTELKINHKNLDDSQKAKFSFFDRCEWDNLVSTGGRLGEMANRANASEEVEKIQQQVVEMREKTEARLGSSFELLLGKTHKYGYFDDELIQRYVCAGDPDEEAEDPSNKQGRFSDITKSAELAISVPQFPLPLRLRDTPGVNDTFMVREQVTLRSLRGSEICLLVLSAHQALNTTDMALIRMVSSFETRQVILFVNRIDELANPGEQIPEIRENITATLEKFSTVKNCEIIFGSAKWAEVALSDDLNNLDEDSQEALFNYAEYADVGHDIDESDTAGFVWALAGIPALMGAIYQRIREGSGARLLSAMNSRLTNMHSELKIEQIEYQDSKISDEVIRLETAEMENILNELADENQAKLEAIIDKQRTNLHTRLERAQNSFVRRATDALITHLDRFGEQDTWQYDATGLRLLLRSSYVQFSATLKKEITTLFAETASSIEKVYFRAVGFEIDNFNIKPPSMPTVPPPVVLARTIALDLSSTWWQRWWQKRKGFEAFASDYASLIQVEVASLVHDLEGEQVAEVFEQIEQTMQDFVQEQRDTLLNISTNRSENLLPTADKIDSEAFKTTLENTLATLDQFAA